MKNCLAMIMLALLSVSAYAVDDDWIMIADNETGLAWYGKSGSAGLGMIGKKTPDVYAAFKEVRKDSPNIRVFTGLVKQADCDRGQGKFIENDMDGRFLASTDFIFGAGTFAASAAESLCSIYIENKKSTKKK